MNTQYGSPVKLGSPQIPSSKLQPQKPSMTVPTTHSDNSGLNKPMGMDRRRMAMQNLLKTNS